MYEVKHGDYVLIGLILDDQEAEKLITFGPSADNTEEIKAFRNFWGSKADTRRFQDGSIRETVAWSPVPHRLIVSSICQFLIDRHLGREMASTLRFELDKFLRVLPDPSSAITVSSREPFRAKSIAFQKLSNFILGLSELPLHVHAVYAASSSLRDSALSLPAPFDLSADDCIGQGIIEFETSSKWTDDINAVEMLKVSFLLEIEKLLNEKSAGTYRAHAGVEVDYMPRGGPNEVGFLQVLSNDGFAFRLRIATERDALLYTRLDKELHTDLTSVYKQKYLSCISHTRNIQTLSQRFPFYSAAVRLVKAWFNAHLLTAQISQEAIELIALKPFLDSAPYLPPGSPTVAFTRTLEFLATWNWRDDPLILDIEKVSDRSRDGDQKLSIIEGTQMDATTYRKLMDSFAKQRVADPALTHAPLFIATKNDITGVTWTQSTSASPKGKVVASRMTALARAAFHVISIPALSAKEKITHIFQPSLGDYDIVIHVQDPQYLEKSSHSSASKKRQQYKNLQITASFPAGIEELAIRIANPVDNFFEDLCEKYKDSIIFFRGTLDAKTQVSIIGGVWHHDVVDPKPFKVNLGYNTIPVVNSGQPSKKKAAATGTNGRPMVMLNKPAILEEIEQLGGDLIDEIQLCK